MNAYGIVAEFERRVEAFAGAPHAVAVDCCTTGLFLSLKYARAHRVTVPARTYVSVPMAVLHAGAALSFRDYDWRGIYELEHDGDLKVWDGAKRFRKGMYAGGLHCLSFHLKKHLPIGRGGMVLCPNADAAAWLRSARYDGREGKPYDQERVTMMGWHAYMTPEQAARGLALLDVLPSDAPPDLTEDYPDLREMPVFWPHVNTECAHLLPEREVACA